MSVKERPAANNKRADNSLYLCTPLAARKEQIVDEQKDAHDQKHMAGVVAEVAGHPACREELKRQTRADRYPKGVDEIGPYQGNRSDYQERHEQFPHGLFILNEAYYGKRQDKVVGSSSIAQDGLPDMALGLDRRRSVRGAQI